MALTSGDTVYIAYCEAASELEPITDSIAVVERKTVARVRQSKDDREVLFTATDKDGVVWYSKDDRRGITYSYAVHTARLGAIEAAKAFYKSYAGRDYAGTVVER